MPKSFLILAFVICAQASYVSLFGGDQNDGTFAGALEGNRYCVVGLTGGGTTFPKFGTTSSYRTGGFSDAMITCINAENGMQNYNS